MTNIILKRLPKSWHGSAVVITVASEQNVSGFEPHEQLESLCVEFECSPPAYVGQLNTLNS